MTSQHFIGFQIIEIYLKHFKNINFLKRTWKTKGCKHETIAGRVYLSELHRL